MCRVVFGGGACGRGHVGKWVYEADHDVVHPSTHSHSAHMPTSVLKGEPHVTVCLALLPSVIPSYGKAGLEAALVEVVREPDVPTLVKVLGQAALAHVHCI